MISHKELSMGKLSSAAAQTDHQAGLLVPLDRALLLAPEALLLTALLCIYTIWPITLVALLVALLVIVFLVRVAALHLARAAIERGGLADASALLKVALFLNPGSPDALALEGALALTNGASSLAVVRLRRAIALLPGQPAIHAALSGALLELNRPAEAAHAARAALALDSRCAVAHLHLAQAEQACGAAAHIVEDRLRAGLAAQPTPAAEAVLRCVLAVHLLAEQRTAEATLTLHGAEALLPRCPAPSQAMLRIQLGEVLIAQGQIERAQEYLQSAAALDPHGRYATVAWRVAGH
jgi:predicted Zn-dependent protease